MVPPRPPPLRKSPRTVIGSWLPRSDPSLTGDNIHNERVQRDSPKPQFQDAMPRAFYRAAGQISLQQQGRPQDRSESMMRSPSAGHEARAPGPLQNLL